jgi:hypothetical protein
MIIRYLILLAPVLACGPLLEAEAILPPATYSIGVQSLASGGSFDYSSPGSYVTGGASADVSIGPAPALTANVVNNGAAYANMTYYFTVLGAPDGTIIPLDISVASLVATETNGSSSQTGIGVSVTDEGSVSEYVGDNQSWSGMLNIDYDEGDGEGSIYLTVSAGVSQLTGTAYGFADPVISVDPAAVNAGEYSVELSEGVGNTNPTVPEPATFVMVGIALGGLFLLRRRGVKCPMLPTMM